MKRKGVVVNRKFYRLGRRLYIQATDDTDYNNPREVAAFKIIKDNLLFPDRVEAMGRKMQTLIDRYHKEMLANPPVDFPYPPFP